MLIVLCSIPTAAALLCGGYLSLIAGKPAREFRLFPFLGWDYAHRGLYRKDQSVPENSLKAFRLAVEHGYGIELDIQLTADGEVVVFHDDSLFRMCGIKAPLSSYTYTQLQKLQLCGTEERIPLFRDVLKLVNGAVPLIVELKSGTRSEELCRKGYELLKEYKGPFCVESFDPRIVRWFYKHAKRVVRGQLADCYEIASKYPGRSKASAFAGANLFGNWLDRPNFIAYRWSGYRNRNLRICKRWFHLLTVAWTIQNKADLKIARRQFDLVIFEHFRPDGSNVNKS